MSPRSNELILAPSSEFEARDLSCYMSRFGCLDQCRETYTSVSFPPVQSMPLENNIDGDAVLNNSWAAHSDTSFTSAIRSRPSVRRRGSDDTTRTRNNHDSARTSHSRSRTFDHVSHGSASSLLTVTTGSPKAESRSTWFSANDTRPRLKRLLSDAEAMLDGSSTSAGGDDHGTSISKPNKDEKIVLVHQVSAQVICCINKTNCYRLFVNSRDSLNQRSYPKILYRAWHSSMAYLCQTSAEQISCGPPTRFIYVRCSISQ